jgi:hypothetical protein
MAAETLTGEKSAHQVGRASSVERFENTSVEEECTK